MNRFAEYSDFTTGCVSTDKRGRHPPKHKISNDNEEFTKSHIRKFNPSASHYRRVHAPNRLDFPAKRDVKERFDDYKLCCEQLHKKCFSYKY